MKIIGMEQMNNNDFLRYFDLDKDTIKFMMYESKIKLDEMAEVLDLDPNCLSLILSYEKEFERFRALKLALIAVDETASLSTVNFDDTLDINKVFGKTKTKFVFDFAKRKGSTDFSPLSVPSPPTPKRK